MTSIILGGAVSENSSLTAKKKVVIELSMLTRHGIIAGATGTGKTVSLQVLVEQFSQQGIPVFTADAKGDLAGVATAGTPNERIDERLRFIGLEKGTDFVYKGFPSVFWDIYGKNGHPIRTTVSEMGPLLLSRLLDLNDTQDAILYMIFKIADDEGLLLVDLKDLKSVINFVGENRKVFSNEYGNISTASLNAIIRQILVLEESGGSEFFGEKAFDFNQLLKKDFSGNGVVNILDAQKLMHNNRIYSAFLLWLLSELFEQLPEVGDEEKPKLVFFFDEAHLLFQDTPKVLVEKIEQVVRLIRSKGVSVFFVTQNALDIPEEVRGQLGNRIQHALRAFTPKEQKSAKIAAQTFRENPAFSTEEKISTMKVGYALVSTLDKDGSPTVVECTMIRPPQSRMGVLTAEERIEKIKNSPVYGIYEQKIDNESAFEVLKERAEKKQKLLEEQSGEKREEGEERGLLWRVLNAGTGKSGKRQGFVETFTKQVIRSLGSRLVTKIVRGILGSMK